MPEQPSPGTASPSSHVSPRLPWTISSPQYWSGTHDEPGVGQVHPLSICLQSAEQPSASTVFLSSHCSPAPTEPSPHTAGFVVGVHASPGFVQVYPFSTEQSLSQPSPFCALPSSQASLPSILEFPHSVLMV